jgi:glutathione S-transferase
MKPTKLYIANRTCSLAAQVVAHEFGQLLDIIDVNAFTRINSHGHDDRLADNRSYLTGKTFTVADAYLFAATPWVERTQVKIGHLKNLRAFQDRVAASPAAQAALRDEAAAAAS